MVMIIIGIRIEFEMTLSNVKKIKFFRHNHFFVWKLCKLCAQNTLSDNISQQR